jgi:hypothetical protein
VVPTRPINVRWFADSVLCGLFEFPSGRGEEEEGVAGRGRLGRKFLVRENENGEVCNPVFER